ncbi:hypothetical protein IV203_001466 [Nitzschia inconspicua]|uniref:Uncharacterized protein n=1 Tax=Nitzschia inconspicua TaxID=303405 RepID=A0A9K3L6W6_9STRA|nr:hypothetical protein IV203_001466 [Nitzschia inconspicua]
MQHDSWNMKPTSSFETLVATASTVLPPTSPQHCKSKTLHHPRDGHYLNFDDNYSPMCVFAASFDSMAAYEEQQQCYKDSSNIEHHISQISLTRSDSQHSISLDDCYDQELMINYSHSLIQSTSIRQEPPPQLRLTSLSRCFGRPSSNSESRPSDPVARLLLNK